MRVHLRTLGLRGFGGGNFFQFDHSIQNRVALVRRAFRIFQRRKSVRTSNQSGEERGFGKIQLRRVLSEVGLRRSLDAVTTGAEINPVHIKLEDLFFGELVLNSKRDHRFEKFPADVATAEWKTVARELLSNTARAFLGRPAQDIAHQRAKNSVPIDSRMLIEAGVFAREERIDEQRRNFVERN